MKMDASCGRVTARDAAIRAEGPGVFDGEWERPEGRERRMGRDEYVSGPSGCLKPTLVSRALWAGLSNFRTLRWF
jgi:hypothetical protein